MPTINAELLKKRRTEFRLSLDDLERVSKVDRTTIHRIEQGKTKRNAKATVERLAKALKMEPDELTDTKAGASEDNDDLILFSRSQMNVRIAHEARNALAFVGARYDVRPIEILEFAPLLFHIFAGESLRARSDRLAQLRSKRSEIESLSSGFPHLSVRLVNDWEAEEIEQLEERSIRTNDIRGANVESENGLTDTRPLDYDEDTDNAFLAFLRERLGLLAAMGGWGGEIDSWRDGWPPRYQICRDEAERFCGGDKEVADDLVNGLISVHEIPKDLRGSDVVEHRLAWLKARIAENAAKQVDLLENLRLEDLL